jgi:uncharacterized protein
MAIRSLTEEEFRQVLTANLTPAATIKTPERLFGRDKALKQIERALGSEGRQIFIYGDRGVGKTSVALTAANLFNDVHTQPIYVLCGQDESFANVVKAIGDALVDITERFENVASPAELGGSFAGFGANFKPGRRGKVVIQPPTSLNEALDVLRYVLAKRSGRIIIVIDEMERMKPAEREKFAELIKNIPELDQRMRFIFCGIANTVNELVGSHPSAGRILEPIELEKLHHNYLWELSRLYRKKQVSLSSARRSFALVRSAMDSRTMFILLASPCFGAPLMIPM